VGFDFDTQGTIIRCKLTHGSNPENSHILANLVEFLIEKDQFRPKMAFLTKKMNFF